MLFNSLAFAIFLPIVFLAYWLIPDKYRWICLLVSSYYFYMSWNAKYVFLILGTTVVSYIAALLIGKTESKSKKKIILGISAGVCLGVLFVFKYFNFAMESVSSVMKLFSIELHPITSKLLLPVGISFYTFQTLSYVIDVYKGKIQPEKHFGYYAAFISFFPQLVAGPIERTSNLLPQLKETKPFEYDNGRSGLQLMLIGFFKKLVVADTLAVFVDRVYSDLHSYSGFSMVLVIFFFTVQIYCDFSGYSDIAIGCAKLFGINLMTNFKSPYFSSSVKEFWGRWHISLSTWFRDYVYIPLGGNRVSPVRHKINLLITFLASGLWHGANRTFVLWGGVHGVAQMLSNRSNKNEKAFVRAVKICVTFIFCNLAWVLFRAQSVTDAFYVYKNIFTGMGSGIFAYLRGGFVSIGCGRFSLLKILFGCGTVFLYDFISLKKEPWKLIEKLPVVLRWMVYAVIVFSIIAIGEFGSSAFIYFAF